MRFKGKLSGNMHEHPDIREYVKNKGSSGKRTIDSSVYKSLYLKSGLGFLGYLIIFLGVAFLFSNLKESLADIFAFALAAFLSVFIIGFIG